MEAMCTMAAARGQNLSVDLLASQLMTAQPTETSESLAKRSKIQDSPDCVASSLDAPSESNEWLQEHFKLSGAIIPEAPKSPKPGAKKGAKSGKNQKGANRKKSKA